MFLSVIAILFWSIYLFCKKRYMLHPQFGKDKTLLLKAILPFAIIAVHSGVIDNPITVGSCAVALFFLISGYGLECKKEQGSFNLTYFKTHIFRVLGPVLLPAITYVALEFFYKGLSVDEIINKNILKYRIILPYTWFVLTFLQFQFFYLIASLANRKWLRIAILFAIIIVYDCLFYALDMPSYSLRANLAFAVGPLIKRIQDSIEMDRRKFSLLTFILSSLSLLLTKINWVGTIIIIPMWSFCFILWLSSFEKGHASKGIQFLSTISYEIYLCQGIAFLLVPKMDSMLFVYYLCVCFASVFFAQCCSWLRNKCLL